MKKKKVKKQLARSQKQLKKAVRKLAKASRADNPAWVTALAAIAGAVAHALSDGDKRDRLRQTAVDTTGKAVGLVMKRRKDEHASDMPNGIAMEPSGAV